MKLSLLIYHSLFSIYSKCMSILNFHIYLLTFSLLQCVKSKEFSNVRAFNVERKISLSAVNKQKVFENTIFRLIRYVRRTLNISRDFSLISFFVRTILSIVFEPLSIPRYIPTYMAYTVVSQNLRHKSLESFFPY